LGFATLLLSLSQSIYSLAAAVLLHWRCFVSKWPSLPWTLVSHGE